MRLERRDENLIVRTHRGPPEQLPGRLLCRPSSGEYPRMTQTMSGTQVPERANVLVEARRKAVEPNHGGTRACWNGREMRPGPHTEVCGPGVMPRSQPKTRPLACVTALVKRSCTSAQLTTFQN